MIRKREKLLIINMILARCDAKSEKPPPKSSMYACKTNPEVPRDPRMEEAITARAIRGVGTEISNWGRSRPN